MLLCMKMKGKEHKITILSTLKKRQTLIQEPTWKHENPLVELSKVEQPSNRVSPQKID